MSRPADLSVPFLIKVLEKLRDIPLVGDSANSWTFYEFVPADYKDDDRKARLFVEEHLEHLRKTDLIELGTSNMYHEYLSVKLSAKGRQFVQPALAAFHSAVAEQLVSEVEAQIDTSPLPDVDKHTLKYKLREALTEHAPDLAVRLIVEILSRIAAAG